MNKIERISRIKYEDIDQKDYLRSLINEAFNLGLISQDDIERIQIQLLELLDNRIYKYNGEESSSIRKEILEQINDSNIYTINMFLKRNLYPDDSLDIINKNSMIDLYEKGRKEIIKTIKETKLLYSKVLQNKINIDNEIYNDTLIGGIKGFFKIYDYEFNAQDMKITADYPLYNNIIGKAEGIEFIKQYLKSIYYENEFCRYFDLNDIKSLLYSYSKDYKYLVVNIFNIILIQTIGCKIANVDIKKLSISNSDLENIKLLSDRKSDNQIDSIILEAYTNIKEELLDLDKNLTKYIENNLNEVIFLIKSSIKNNTLERVFLINNLIF